MNKMAVQHLLQLLTVFLIVLVTITSASSPPKYSIKSRNRAKGGKKGIHAQHYEENRGAILHDAKNIYHTKSDAMQLYSIAAKGIVRVEQNDGPMSWNKDYTLSVIQKKGHHRNQNKFVTETVSYGKLKIKSEDNNHYICARSNGDIIFKSNGTNKRGKIRKRCLFRWSFTKQMHIKLSVQTDSETWFLTVQNDRVSLKKASDSTELNKSFIWLPAISSKNSDSSRTKKRPRVIKHITKNMARGFSLESKCSKRVNKKLLLQNWKISFLEEQLQALKKHKQRLEKELKSSTKR